MLNRNAQYQEWLLPYLEKTLDEAQRAQLEARLAADADLAAEAEHLRRTLIGLRGTAMRTPSPENAQVPAGLWPHLQARLVLEPAPRPRPRVWWVAGLGAPAAAALIVAAIWLPGWHALEMHPPHPHPAASMKAPAPRSGSAAIPTVQASKVPTANAPSLKAAAPTAPKAAVPGQPPTAPATAPPNPFALPHPAAPAQGDTPLVPGAPAGSAPGVKPPVPTAPVTAPAAQPPPAFRREMPAGGDTVRDEAAPPSVTEAKPAPSPPAPSAALKAGEPGGVADVVTPNKAPAAEQGRNSAQFGGGGFGGGVGQAAAPKGAVNGLDEAARQQAKAAVNALNTPSAVIQGQTGQTSAGALRPKPLRRTRGSVANGAIQSLAANPQAALDSWQSALSAAEQPPLWGENAGDQQANQALMAARESGLLDDLRARLEARQAQTPQDVLTGRMLAAVYDFGASPELALRERRRISGLQGATGEDWYALAQAEDRAHNASAARAAYRQALESSVPPSSYHATIARTRI